MHHLCSHNASTYLTFYLCMYIAPFFFHIWIRFCGPAQRKALNFTFFFFPFKQLFYKWCRFHPEWVLHFNIMKHILIKCLKKKKKALQKAIMDITWVLIPGMRNCTFFFFFKQSREIWKFNSLILLTKHAFKNICFLTESIYSLPRLGLDILKIDLIY